VRKSYSQPEGPGNTKTITVATNKTPGLDITEGSFEPANQSAGDHMQGMTVKDQKAIQMVSNKHGVDATFRPTNPDAHDWIESGKAVPKKEYIKTKTVNGIDTEHLGYSDDHKGLSACKKPNPLPTEKPPAMDDETWGKVKDRHSQRTQEYNDQATKLQHLEADKKVVWDKETGLIYDKKTGKPFAGDNDAFAFTDSVTGRPVSPTVNAQINKELQASGATQHNEHLGWDYSKADNTVAKGAGSGAQSPLATAKGIDNKILNSHAPPGVSTPGAPAPSSQPLITYKSLGDKWQTNYWKGGSRK
jgi:hypothetical protein